jgi:hypothetical protein
MCVEQVDVNELQPPQATDRVFATVHALRL